MSGCCRPTVVQLRGVRLKGSSNGARRRLCGCAKRKPRLGSWRLPALLLVWQSPGCMTQLHSSACHTSLAPLPGHVPCSVRHAKDATAHGGAVAVTIGGLGLADRAPPVSRLSPTSTPRPPSPQISTLQVAMRRMLSLPYTASYGKRGSVPRGAGVTVQMSIPVQCPGAATCCSRGAATGRHARASSLPLAHLAGVQILINLHRGSPVCRCMGMSTKWGS